MSWLLLIFLVFYSQLESTVAQNCSTDDRLCSACKGLGSTAYTKYIYTPPFCSILYRIDDHNSVNTTVSRCEQSFSSGYNMTVECQLPVFTDFNLTNVYTTNGIRAADLTYFIGMVRGDNCSSQMYYQAANGYRTPNGNITATCEKTWAAFDGLNVATVDPNTFHTNSIACQCGLAMDDLPGTNSGNLHFFYVTSSILLLIIAIF